MQNNVTVSGLIASEPRSIATSEGVSIASFRLASTQRRQDSVTGVWVESETNWYTVSAFHQLARNISESLRKGERVIINGTLRLRSHDGKTMTAEIEANTVGLDLNHYVVRSKERTQSEPVAPSLDEN